MVFEQAIKPNHKIGPLTFGELAGIALRCPVSPAR
jgi:hypothetical protein